MIILFRYTDNHLAGPKPPKDISIDLQLEQVNEHTNFEEDFHRDELIVFS